MGEYSHTIDAYNTAERYRNMAGNSTVDNWEQMANVLYKLTLSTNSAVNAIQNLQQTVYNQLGTPASLITENPKQKSDLEISNRIEISDEFLNLKIDN